MKKVLVILVAVLSAYLAHEHMPSVFEPSTISTPSNRELERAITERRSGVQVRGSGTVARILSDDNYGSRHQRFIVTLDTGRTLLVAHNIDLAPRVRDLQTGDDVAFFGEYEWNEKGGVIHWTHHDPRAQHVGGWIEVRGTRYE